MTAETQGLERSDGQPDVHCCATAERDRDPVSPFSLVVSGLQTGLANTRELPLTLIPEATPHWVSTWTNPGNILGSLMEEDGGSVTLLGRYASLIVITPLQQL